MTDVAAVADRYLTLAVEASAGPGTIVELFLGDPGAVDARRNGSPRPYGEVAAEAERLATGLEHASPPAERSAYVAAQLRALAVACRSCAGDAPPFPRLVSGALGGVRAAFVEEARFDEAISELDALVPGTGDLRGRLERWRRRRGLPPDRLAAAARRLVAEARRRTAACVSFPAGDAVEVAVVRDRPWSASCVYLGRLRSRIEISADEPPTFARLVDLVCHEAYPGHHTERVLQELWCGGDEPRPECVPLLATGPSSVLSEGLASLAAAIVFGEDELRAVAGAAGLRAGDIEEEVVEWRAATILSRLRAVNSNVALVLQRGATPAEAAEYLVRYGLRTPERAERIAAWMADPLRAAYMFAYPAGASLVEALVARDGPEGALRLLLSEPALAGSLAAQLPGASEWFG